MAGDSLSVLLASNDPDFVRVLRVLLSSDHSLALRLEVVAGLDEARETLAASRFDAVLFDAGASAAKADGALETLRLLAAGAAVVVLADTVDRKAALELLDSGVQDCLSRHDLTSWLLVRTILYAVERRRCERVSKDAHRQTEREIEARSRELRLANDRLQCEITRNERNHEAILKAKREWEATFDIVPDLIAILDSEHRILRLNRAMAAKLGLDEAQCIGQPCYDLMHGTSSPDTQCPHTLALADGAEHTAELLCGERLGGGHYIVTASPLRGPDGEVTGTVHVARDITSLKATEETLLRRTQELLTRNADLDAYARTVAHDLKGPIGNVFAASRMLLHKGESLPREQRRNFLVMIAEGSCKAGTIIDELLLLAKIRLADVEMRAVDMNQVLDDVQSRLQYMVSERKAEVAIPPALPRALGHGPWLAEVWYNYISNALKYGGNPPRIEVGGSPQPDGMVSYWVSDNGPGLNPEEQQRLFQPFCRLDQVSLDGQGLGLSIVRHIVEKHQGRAGVESEIGRGSKFYFVLPGEGRQPRPGNGNPAPV